MAPTFQAAGTFQSGGAVQLTVPWPTHQAGDIGFLLVNSNSNVGLLTAEGFVETADSPQLGTSCGLQVFWKRATGSSEASPVTNTGNNNISAVIATVRDGVASGDPWDVTVGGTGVLSTSISTPSDTSTVDDCLILYCIGRGSDAAGAVASGEADSNVTNLTEQVDNGTATGNGGGLILYTANRVTAGAFGPLTATLSVTGTKAYVLLAIKPSSGTTVTPAVVPTTTTVPTPTVLAASNVTPAVVPLITTVPTPLVAAAANVEPAVVAAITTVPTPSVQAGAVVEPAVIPTVVTVPTPTVAAGDTVVTPAVVATVTTVPTPTIQAGAEVSPATVTTVATVPTPTVAGEGIGNPATVATVTTVPTPTIQAGAVVTPAVVPITTTVPTPNVAGASTVTPATVVMVTTVPTPVAQGAVLVAPATVPTVTTVPTPTVTAGATVTPAIIPLAFTVPTPTIQAGPIATITLPATATISAADNEATIGDDNRVAVLSSANRTGTIR